MGAVELGDRRRNERAVAMGAAMAAKPDSSLPAQMQGWNELRASYRLLNEADVSHARLSQPHREQTHQKVQQSDCPVVVMFQDSSEISYGRRPQRDGLGVIGKGRSQGLMLHSCLAVVPDGENPEILGLAAQQVWARSAQARHRGSGSKRTAKRSEGDKWAESIEAIGEAPQGSYRWVSVGDRESDVFSYIRRCRVKRWHTLVRVSQNRRVRVQGQEQRRLKDYARSLTGMSQKTLRLRGRDGAPQQTIVLNLAWAAVEIEPPKAGPEQASQTISGWCIRCWQPEAEGLEWILLTTVDPALYDAAMQVEWYACRWLIEEYHKCLKSGCRIEQRQLESGAALMRLIGFLAIVAVRLLQLRTLSRIAPDTPAERVIPEGLLNVVVARLKLFSGQMSLGEFWRAVARLGGFIGRKSDGQPGWQTLWRGWLCLQDLAWGLQPEDC